MADQVTSVEEMHADSISEPRMAEDVHIQPGGYLLELSLDWLVLRASQNVHRLLDRSHVALIGEPLGEFVHAQALHDLRNLFSRLSGTTGIARAYRVRLTDETGLYDVAFQVSGGRVILEAVPSPEQGFGEAFGTVGGLIGGLSKSRDQALLDGGARRMRALTGYDRVTLVCGDKRAESSRGSFVAPCDFSQDCPAIFSDNAAEPVAIFPRQPEETSVHAAVMRSPMPEALDDLRGQGIRAMLRVGFDSDGETGEFRCDCRTARDANLEVHAAAELFAQLFAMRLAMDRLKD
jgi:light-regulated signal transduction histidine kinase (bacteriophytochrome)